MITATASQRRPIVEVTATLDKFSHGVRVDLSPVEAKQVAHELERAARAAMMIAHKYIDTNPDGQLLGGPGTCEVCGGLPFAPQHTHNHAAA